jgi:hypothetical protein
MKYLFAVLSLFFVYTSLSNSFQEENDTLCFKYDLRAGDTLTYHVASHDSIIIDFEEPLLRTRYERIVYRVDSVKNGMYFMTYYLDKFIGKESQGDLKNVNRESSPWENVKIFMQVDSLGNRFKQRIINPESFGITPGGAFQPYLFFPIKESCKKINESWLVKSTDTLAENAFPYPIMDGTSMMRVVGNLDTLGHYSKRFRYVKSAQAFYYLMEPGDTTEVFARINSGGRLTFSHKLNIPVHYFATIEQRLTFTYSNGREIPGWHFTSTNFTLESFRRKQNEDID